MGAAGGRRVLQPMMSMSTKSEPLGMMTRSAYNEAEEKLNRQGLSLENIVDNPRQWIPVKKEGVCSELQYPNEVYVGNVAVRYNNANFYACFSPWATHTVNIAYTGSRTNDYAAANTAAGLAATPPGFTWHHVENYNNGTMQGTMELVPSALHNHLFHYGGVQQYVNARGGPYGA